MIYRFEFLGVCVGVHATPTTLDPNRGDTAAAKQSIRNNTGLLEPIAGHYFRRRFRQFLEPLRTIGHTASSLRPWAQKKNQSQHRQQEKNTGRKGQQPNKQISTLVSPPTRDDVFQNISIGRYTCKQVLGTTRVRGGVPGRGEWGF